MRSIHTINCLIVLFVSLLITMQTQAQQTYTVHYVEKLPQPAMHPSRWEWTGRVSKTIAIDSRLVKYGSEAAKQLTNDSVIRVLDAKDADATRPTSFMMAYNSKGWYLYFQSTDPAIDKAIKQKSNQSLELFFSTSGPQDPNYSRLAVDLITGQASVSDQSGRTDTYRPLGKYLQVNSEVLPDGQAWGTCLFIPWEYFYDRLPLDGQSWSFTFMRWGTGTSVTWGGKVHEKGAWGQIEWQKPTDAQRQQILSTVIQNAWKTYQDEATKALQYWKIFENDPVFFTQKVQPVIDAYNQQAELVKNVAKLDESQVAKLYTHAKQWMNFDLQLDRLRRDYLQQRLIIGEPGPSNTQ